MTGTRIVKRFRIHYRDPASETGEWKTVTESFSDTPAGTDDATGFKYPAIIAREWAMDFAYTLADKGPYEITEIKDRTPPL